MKRKNEKNQEVMCFFSHLIQIIEFMELSVSLLVFIGSMLIHAFLDVKTSHGVDAVQMLKGLSHFA